LLCCAWVRESEREKCTDILVKCHQVEKAVDCWLYLLLQSCKNTFLKYSSTDIDNYFEKYCDYIHGMLSK